jgi:hypothetical protein
MAPLRTSGAWLALLAVGALASGCGSSPAAPDRTGPVTVIITCTSSAARVSTCIASVSCGLYGCRPGTPVDATSTSNWTSDDPSIVRIVSAGLLEAAAPGNTVVRATHQLAGQGTQSISVFPGTAPLPTFVLAGTVFDGSDPSRLPLNGATIQVLSGLVGGRTATSGTEAQFMPGFWPPGGRFPAGAYEIFGVPSGNYRLRVSKTGYVPQERDIGPASLVGNDFVLPRQ